MGCSTLTPVYDIGTVAETIWRKFHEGMSVEQIAAEQEVGRRFVHDVIVEGWAREEEE